MNTTCCNSWLGHNATCTDSDRALAILRRRLNAPSLADRTVTVRVTFRDGFTVDVSNVDLHSVAMDDNSNSVARATLAMETTDDRIVRFPIGLVAFWEALV